MVDVMSADTSCNPKHKRWLHCSPIRQHSTVTQLANVQSLSVDMNWRGWQWFSYPLAAEVKGQGDLPLLFPALTCLPNGILALPSFLL